jgi:hypothetical protein
MQDKFKLEDFFLKLFKVAILVMMTITILAMFVLLITATYESSKRPTEPAPAQKAPQRDVSLEELKKELLKETKPTPEAAPQQQPKVPPTLKYLEEVTRVYRCSTEFAKKVGAEIDETDNSVIAQRVEELRNQVERYADEREHRGDRWVKSAVEFTCVALTDPSIIAMRKEGKVKAIFFPILNYHLRTWDRIEAEKAEFERAELERVESEREAERMRILEAKARAINQLFAAGIAFGVFMALALYLILAKIENNLRNINATIEVFGHARTHEPSTVEAR